MKVIELVVEQTPLHEVIVNGRDYRRGDAKGLVNEVLFRKFNLEQQWSIICELQKTVAKCYNAYEETRLRAKEISEAQLYKMRRARYAGAKNRTVVPAFMSGSVSGTVAKDSAGVKLFVPDFEKKKPTRALKVKAQPKGKKK